MDEEGYEFGEAVKEAMAQGYKDGGLMVAIQRFNQGGNVIDSRATVEDMAKSILTSSAANDNQKLQLLMDYDNAYNSKAVRNTQNNTGGQLGQKPPLFNNSNQTITNFQLNYKTVSLSSIAFILAILSLNKVSEFLYFNFYYRVWSHRSSF